MTSRSLDIAIRISSVAKRLQLLGWVVPSFCRELQRRLVSLDPTRNGAAQRESTLWVQVPVRVPRRARLHHPQHRSRQRQLAHQVRTANAAAVKPRNAEQKIKSRPQPRGWWTGKIKTKKKNNLLDWIGLSRGQIGKNWEMRKCIELQSNLT